MSIIITRTNVGAIDLYNGIPNLKNAMVENIIYDDTYEDYRTILVLRDVSGNQHRIIIAKA